MVRLFAIADSTGSVGAEVLLSFNGLAKRDRAKMNGAVMVMCFRCLYVSKMRVFFRFSDPLSGVHAKLHDAYEKGLRKNT